MSKSVTTGVCAVALAALLPWAGASAAPEREASAPASRVKAPKDIVDLRDVAPSILHDIRYRTRHNFVGERIEGYQQARCLLTKAAATQLAKVQRDVQAQGYTLKVYDCYRPQRAVSHFVRWAQDIEDDKMKPEFYPRVDKSTLFDDGYIAERSGHSRASTVDLTLVPIGAKPQQPWNPVEGLQPCYLPQDERFPDNSIDMGTGYDCFDTRSHTDDPRNTPAQEANRNLLRSAMAAHGFSNYVNEWWHFTLKPEPYPDTFFDFPVSRAALTDEPKATKK